MTRRAVPLVLLLLTGCAVEPKFHPPLSPNAAAAGFVTRSPALALEPPPQDWWRLFNSPDLDRLISDALAANKDLTVANANLRRARSALLEARAGRLPSTDLSTSATKGYASSESTAALTGRRGYESYAVGLDVSYEVDLFGRVSRSIEAARADAAAQEAARDVVRVSVVAETARAYAGACAAAHQLAVANQTLSLQQQTLDLTRRLLADGRNTPLDVARAAALVEQYRANIPTFATQRTSALFRLAVLTGRHPSQAPEMAVNCTSTPRVTSALPVGDGEALIRRRPDIRQAEQRLAAYTARVGVATADLYPSIRLLGSAGWSGARAGDLGQGKTFQYSIGPLISWSFPNQVAARARVREAKADVDAALATFDKTVLEGLQDADTALTTYANELDRNAALVNAAAQAKEAARIVDVRYRAGKENFLAVLDAERTLAGADAALAASDAALVDDQILVFKALGGGWAGPADPSGRSTTR